MEGGASRKGKQMTEAGRAQELREQARRMEQEAVESFERSDTDGFLSQWASNISASRARLEAALIEDGGMTETTALFLLDGTLASTHKGEGQYGPYWVLNDEAAERLGRRFLSTSQAAKPEVRSRNNAKKGVAVGRIRVRGEAVIEGRGRGLSGTAWATIRPVVRDLIEGKFEVLTRNEAEEEERGTG